MSDKISRRRFLQLAAGGAAGALLSACVSQPAPTAEAPQEEAVEEAAAPAATEAPQEEEAAAPEPTEAPQEEVAEAPASSGKYKEAPMLAALVAAGELPIVD